MSASVGPRRPSAQPPHIPKLSYRKAAPPGEIPTWEERQTANVAKPSSAPVSPMLGQNGFAIPLELSSSQDPNSRIESPLPPQKRKSSVFSGFFSKEPSQAALNQVAAQLVAQHGSINATKVPHVSMEKMPSHVPRVNSKWDGLPDSVRAADKKDPEKSTRRNSVTGRGRSGSLDWGQDAMSRRVRDHSGNSKNTTRSNSSSRQNHSLASKVSIPHTRQSSFKSESRPTQFTEKATPAKGLNVFLDGQSDSNYLPSSSASNLPEITAFFDGEIPTAQSVPSSAKKFGKSPEVVQSHEFISPVDARGPAEHFFSPPTDLVMARDRSPTQSSLGGSPVTPSPLLEARFHVYDRSDRTRSGSENSDWILNALDLKPKSKKHGQGFLAGEARPFEIPDHVPVPEITTLPLRPRNTVEDTNLSAATSSIGPRPGLQSRSATAQNRSAARNLRVLKPDIAPWETTDSPSHGKASPRSPAPLSPNPSGASGMLSRSFSRLVKPKP